LPVPSQFWIKRGELRSEIKDSLVIKVIKSIPRSNSIVLELDNIEGKYKT
jgi:hypothetical protein